ncbi:MAG: 4-hydroxy-tetrahydrodipicolinate reductase [Alphaproteobacteria bacterium]|nr:4-hydroxy-tetrahydrodipicolinate reductase [Alphaproteobacteria bacterium]
MKIGVVGCGGRMGRTLLAEILNTTGAALAGGTEHPESDLLGRDVASLIGEADSGHAIIQEAADLFKTADAVIDFTAPAATAEHAALAADHGTPLIIGTTGMEAEHQRAVDQAAEEVAIVQAPNFSVGVNVLLQLTRQLAGILDEDFDIEVLEMHHRHKVDAPSGTALALGQAAAEGRAVELDAVADRGRDGQTGARKRGDIGFAVLRGGNVVGDHTVFFAAENERIELTHKAGDRSIFARGAVRSALWAVRQKPGLYSMKDVLGF